MAQGRLEFEGRGAALLIGALLLGIALGAGTLPVAGAPPAASGHNRANPHLHHHVKREAGQTAVAATGFTGSYAASSTAAPLGGAWSSLGPQPLTNPVGPMAGRVTALAVDPTNSAIVYAGTAGGGVWKSSTAGSSWSPTTDAQATLAIGALAVDPNSPSTVYAGTGEANDCHDCMPSQGVLKSTDGGASWSLSGQAIFTATSTFIAQMAVDRSNSGHILAATNRGLYVSTDGGASWSATISSGVQQIAQDPLNGTRWWAAFADWCGSEAGTVATSTDGGTTWTTLYTAPARATRIALGLGTTGTSVTAYAGVAACASTAGTEGRLVEIAKTVDGGASWTSIKPGSALPDYFAEPAPVGSAPTEWQGWYDNVVGVDPSNPNHAVFGGVTLLSTTNGGTSFTDVARPYGDGPLHPDFHAVAFTAHDAFYTGNDGGVWKTTDLGGSGLSSDWTDLNQTFASLLFYAGNALDLTHMAGGTQDNGTDGMPPAATDTGSHPWDAVLDGDGGWTALNPSQPNIVYAEYSNLGLHRVDTSTGTKTSAGPCPDSSTTDPACNDPAGFIAPFLMDPSMPSRLYAATNHVYRSTTGGIPAGTVGSGSWTSISGDLTTKTVFVATGDWIHAMAIGAGSNSGTVATGSDYGKVFISRNADQPSPTWADITTGLPSRSSGTPTGNSWITGLAVNPANGSELWATIGQLGAGRVWHTTDGGTTWSDLTGTGPTGLPNVVVDSITVDPTSGNTVYVGTDAGAYACTTCGGGTTVATWMPLGSQLPNVRVDALTLTRDGAYLVAWTHGRGAWSLPRPVPAPVADVSPTSIDFGGQNVNTTSQPRTATLSNNGTAALQISSIATSDSEFSQSNTCASALLPKTSCSISVTFHPTASGSRTGTLSITDNAPNSPQTVALQGQGTTPAVQLQPTSLAFGDQSVGTTSASRIITVTNTGTGPLTISGINASGDFAQTNNCPPTLPSSGRCAVAVTFTPAALGPRSGALTMTDDASPGTQSAGLSGTGVPPSSWESLGGSWASGPGLSSWATNRIDAFIRGGDSALWHLWWNGTGWSAWQSLGGQFQDDPAAVSWSHGDGSNRIDVFYRGTDNQLWHRWWDGSRWSGFEPQGGILTSGPASASWASNRLDVFVRGTDNQLWHKWWDGAHWSGWEPLGGQLASDPTAVSWGPNRIDVFVRGTDNQAWHKWWDGASWSNWEPQGGAVGSGLDVATQGANRLDVFMLASDNSLWRKSWDGSAWGSWTKIGGSWSSDPGAISQVTGSVDLFERGTDQALWHERLSP